MSPVPNASRTVKLPRTSTRVDAGYAFVKLLSSVRRDSYSSVAFEGQVLKPGEYVDSETLGNNPVLLECAGPQGKGRNREFLWLLWRYDWPTAEWVEIARAQSSDGSWGLALREPALAALHPRPELRDVKQRGLTLADTIIHQIDEELTEEEEAVRMLALNAVYDRVAGRIAELAA